VFKPIDWMTIRLSKVNLMNRVLTLLQTGALKFDPRMEHLEGLFEALTNMELNETASGQTTMSGKRLGTDDLALALAYACIGFDDHLNATGTLPVNWA